ncbi:MAG: HD domain-containing protein [Clostridia bacterium]|nr:HD domain-containing protein [Clostridia bacterium]
MLKYEKLSAETEAQMLADRQNGTLPAVGFSDPEALRRNGDRDQATVLRPAFIRDIDKILHCPYYNRYADKTQVFSFYKNDDITRRGLHVQLVSRIARTIGRALNLNLELIEAIALGHDIGHTPFGHAGERFLDELLAAETGRHFAHNLHSVRVLDQIYPFNITLQTLNGIAAHNGEMEQSLYRPAPLTDFETFDRQIEDCCLHPEQIKKLTPCTLEGCVVRISDIIAYLGKDRQDAERANLIENRAFRGGTLGTYNAEIINNMIVNIVEHSYGKPYIKMDDAHFEALQEAKRENYGLIYKNEAVEQKLNQTVRPMMQRLYARLLADLKEGNTASPIFTHHIAYVCKAHYNRTVPYEQTEPTLLVTDYIASMTDDYFVDLFAHLFPKSELKIEYKGYFDN